MEMTFERINAMVDKLPGNYIVLAVENGSATTLHHTCKLTELTGVTAAEAADAKDPYKLLLEEDKEMIRAALHKFYLSGQDNTDLLFRMVHRAKGFIWVHMLVRHYGLVEGRTIYLANLVDSTKETMISYALMDASDRYICVIEKATKRILYANEKFYGFIESNAAESVGKHCFERLCKVAAMKTNNDCLCYSSLNADPPLEYYDPVKKMHMTITGREVVWGEYDAYVFYMCDITEKKQREAELADSQKRFEVALENSDLMVWEYDIVNSRCIASQKATNDYSIPLIIENYPESLYSMGHTPPETVEQIKECKRRLLAGETGFSVERRTVNDAGNSQWQKVEYTLECDETGKPLRAIVCGLDITKQKELEAKYEEQMEYRNKFAQNSLFSARLDLDSDCLLDHTCSSESCEKIVKKSATATALLHNYFAEIEFDKGAELTRHKLTREALIETYELGQSQYRTVCHNIRDGKYLELNLYMYKNPGNKHLEVFYIVSDVTENILRQKALASVASEGYDYVALVDTRNGKACMVAQSPSAVLPELAEDWKIDYDEIIMRFAASTRGTYQTEEDYYAVGEGMKLAAIREKLAKAPEYEFSCRTQHGSAVHTYRLRFTFADDTKNYILFTRANITKAVQEEHAIQKKLEEALQNAREANRAKTDFLARMSHDMRTPMNAIIGLSALTLDDAKKPSAVRENMSKMRASSDFLLGLVNDILDMAKIEDGSVVLKPEPYSYFDFLSNLKTMFEPQCEAKGLHLSLAKATSNPVVNVDKMRLNQIFFNVFSNAVKYTPAGGSIDFRVKQSKVENGKLKMQFTIQDTGIGMSKEYKKHLFEPFMQENNEATADLQGSGLGLSITKQLVDLMEGQIAIESEKGKGTTVCIDFTFDCLAEDADHTPAINTMTTGGEKLAGKHILLAEDHPLNAQIACRLLEKKGMNVTHVENGKLAVDRFGASVPGTYDMILMDIRMPEMSGLDAVRSIRALNRPDAKQIPIIAMSANAYAEDVEKSLKAGMNAHLAKPVEPDLLYETIAKYLAE